MTRVALACGLGVAILMHGDTAEAQTVANGPYYAMPAWDQTIPAAQRFVVLANMNSDAVLDRETGLVWQRAAGIFEFNGMVFENDWLGAIDFCRFQRTGNRLGWRLPTVEELASLFDARTSDLPAGHPFKLAPVAHWTATTDITPIWALQMTPGGSPLFGANNKALSAAVVCVRGGQSMLGQ